ncbi:MAG: TVP38/TMEM64 family protein [Myxococcota bacterium]|nr:TVP38/TMEM64 family protein [Myxococcota bacterium]
MIRSYGKWALGVFGLVALVLAGREAAGSLDSFASWIEGLGIWAPIVFITGYAVAVASLLPGSVLTIAGGAIFGLGAGTAYAFGAAVLGSIGGFLIARYLARGWVEQRIETDERFRAIDRAVAENGLKITFLLRLSPAFPFSFLNYVLGLTRVSFRDYLLASFGMLPGTLLYVYYGKLAGDVASAAAGAPQGNTAGLVINLVGLVATIAVTVSVTRIARRALAQATESTSEEAR